MASKRSVANTESAAGHGAVGSERVQLLKKRQAWGYGVAWLSVAGLIACAPPASMTLWKKDFLTAERSLQHGDAMTARQTFAALARSAPRPAERQLALLRVGHCLEHLQRAPEAVQLYRMIATKAKDPDMKARAWHEGGRVLLDAIHQPAQGTAWLQQAIETAPDSEAARSSLMRLKQHFSEDATQGQHFFSLLQNWYRRFPTSALADNFLFEAALQRLSAADAAQRAEATPLLRRIVTNHENSGLWDDALWKLADLAQSRGDVADELHSLMLIVSRGANRFRPGGIEPEHLDRAQWRIGRRLFWRLGRYDLAAAAFEQLYDSCPTSRLRDDALWMLGQSLDKQGRHDEAWLWYRRLLKEFPESRYVVPIRNLQRREPGHDPV